MTKQSLVLDCSSFYSSMTAIVPQFEEQPVLFAFSIGRNYSAARNYDGRLTITQAQDRLLENETTNISPKIKSIFRILKEMPANRSPYGSAAFHIRNS